MTSQKARLCRCDGWWEQDWCGRQMMDDLFLSFEGNRIEGSGRDMVGPFMFSGLIDEAGTVVMQKNYLGKHSVKYVGLYDGEGTMSGEWSVDFDTGPWRINIRRAEAGSQNEIVEFVPGKISSPK